MRPQVGHQAGGRAVGQVLVQQQLDQDRDAQDTLGDDAGGPRRGDDAGLDAAVTGGAVAVAAEETTVGLDFDLQEGGVLGAAARGEGPAPALATALVPGDRVVFDDGRQVGESAAFGPGAAGLLAAASLGWCGPRGGRGRGGRTAALGLGAEEWLLAQTQLGAEWFDCLLEEGFTLEGAFMQSLPGAGLSPGLELLGQTRADGARAVGQGWGGAGRGDRKRSRRSRSALRNNRERRHGSHPDRWSPAQATGQRT